MRRTRADELTFRSNELTELPDSIGQLTNLRTLSLSSNRLTSLPESIGQLTQLRTLRLNSCPLTSLPESIGQLTNLAELSLGRVLGERGDATAVLDPIGALSGLQWLDLRGNGLTELPSSMAQLRNLRSLNIESNDLRHLPRWMTQLNLTYLCASTNPFDGFPAVLFEMDRLQNLDLYRCGLTSIPSDIRSMGSLASLNIGANELRDLPDELIDLDQLETLKLGGSFGGNPLERVPGVVPRLGNLRSLGLRGCRITDLPAEVGKMSALELLDLSDNPLNPELEAASAQGLDAVRTYLLAKVEGSVILDEVKLVLVGEGDVGKTSLLGALRGDPWIENRVTTHGVEVDVSSFRVTDPDDGATITFNAWDFGGQDIYKHTHQMFFTAPAIYLAVWDPRGGPDKCRVDDWIKLVKHRAYEESRPDERPRVLIVATRGGPDSRLDHIDQIAIRDEFGSLIEGFHHVDSKPDSGGHRTGIDKLERKLVGVARTIPQVGRSVPESWRNVLHAIRARSDVDAYISYSEFLAICEETGVHGDLAHTYARILSELGHFIHFANDAALSDTVILKPEFLSKAISFVLEDRQTRDQSGLVQHVRLASIWDSPSRPEGERYGEELHPIFLRLMQRFDLSYELVMPNAGTPATSLIAQLVPGGRPDDWRDAWPDQPQSGDSERKQVCRIVDAETGRTVAVEGLVYRLIVRLHRYSLGRSNYLDSRHWKTGLILDDDFNGRALVEEVGGDIEITVRAAYPERFLSHLCAEVEWLVDHFWKGLDCRQSVPCHPPCKGLHEVKALTQTKRRMITETRCSVCENFYEIDSLLATVAPRPPVDVALAEIKAGVDDIRLGVDATNSHLRRLISIADERFADLMNVLTDEARNGPRLFSFEPVEPGFWNKPNWIAERFALTLWCEHRRLPLTHPELNGGDDQRGVYTIELTREWLRRAAPYLKVLAETLSLALPIASSAAQVAMDPTAYALIENQLDAGKACADSVFSWTDEFPDWTSSDDPGVAPTDGRARLAGGPQLRQLHAMLRENDPAGTYGGLVLVQDKRFNFLWVHEDYAHLY